MNRKINAAFDYLSQAIEVQTQQEKLLTAQKLVQLADVALGGLRESKKRSTTVSRRRELQRRETELDAKGPVKPVTVAEPHKPKPMRYSGKG